MKQITINVRIENGIVHTPNAHIEAVAELLFHRGLTK